MFGCDAEPALKGAFTCGSSVARDNRRVNPLAHAKALRRCPALRLALLAAALAGAAALSAARAGETRDHERARTAVLAGEVLPLPTLLERLRRTHPGQVLELELERDDGRWIYEVRMLQAGGQLLKLEVDAATGEVLQARRKKGDAPRWSNEAPR